MVSKKKVYFDITQNLNSIDVLYKIKKNLGFGSVLIRKEDQCHVGVYYVTGQKNFERLVNLFNGNLVTNHKQDQFKNWLDTYNKQYNQNIFYILNINNPSLQHGWLSGFIDALGCFSARLKPCFTSKSGFNLLVEFSIAQKQDSSLRAIRNLFNIPKDTNLGFDISYSDYRFYLTYKKHLVVLVHYLKIYKLKTKKHIYFLTWSKIHHLVYKKMHLTPFGLSQVKKYISQIRHTPNQKL